MRENPLNTAAGQQEIIELSRRTRPQAGEPDRRLLHAGAVLEGGRRDAEIAGGRSRSGARLLQLPSASNSSSFRWSTTAGSRTPAQTETLLRVLLDRASSLSKQGVKIVFESDLPPAPLAQFIDKFPREVFGINYDSGNSAALGYDSAEEISAYAPRILNVHVKDRLLGGTTVPLGTGAADLAKTIRLIEQSGYRGQYVLQTARATDGDHAGVLARYRDMTVRWIEDARR